MSKKLTMIIILVVIASLGVAGIFVAPLFTKNKLGIVLYEYSDPFILNLGKQLESLATTKGKFEVTMLDSQSQQSLQDEHIDTLLSKGAKVLAVNMVDTNSSPEIIEKAKRADVPIVFFNRDVHDAIESYDKAYYVGSEPAQSGKIQGELIVEKWKTHSDWDLNGDGVVQYVLLEGEQGHPDAEARSKWAIKVMQSNDLKVKELHRAFANWNREQAKAKMREWLKSDNHRIEMVIANNDAMAIGALDAMREQGNILPTFGVDAIPEALTLVKSGELQGTVLNDSENQAEAIYTLVSNLAKGRKATEGSYIKMESRRFLIGYIGITDINVDGFSTQ